MGRFFAGYLTCMAVGAVSLPLLLYAPMMIRVWYYEITRGAPRVVLIAEHREVTSVFLQPDQSAHLFNGDTTIVGTAFDDNGHRVYLTADGYVRGGLSLKRWRYADTPPSSPR